MGLSTKRKLACFLPQVFKPEGTARVVRLGSDNKGGHVVAADAVASTRNLLSLGLAPNFDFEIDFAAMAPLLQWPSDDSQWLPFGRFSKCDGPK